MNKWGYRVDPSTAGQRLANKKENYDDVQSYQLNAHQGLKIVKEYTTEEDVPVTLCSLADFYAAVSGNTGYIRQFTDSAMVDKVNGILNGDNIVMIEVSGLATSQDNNKKAGRKLTPANRGMHSKCDFLESGISYSRFRLEINNI